MDAVIYGATGYTGRLVAAAIQRRGLQLAIAGRDRTRLEEVAEDLGGDLEIRVAHVHDASTLREAIADASVVVNCAGPFKRLGEPVVQACIEAGSSYLDCTGEQGFMREIYERYEGAARRSEVAVVNGFAFEVALGDWAAELAARALPGPPLDKVSISYAIDHFKTTTGTRLSILSSLEDGGVTWHHDRWEPVNLAAESRPVRFPEPFGLREALSFPSGEVVTVPRHIDTTRVQSYIAVTHDSAFGKLLGQGAALVSPFLGALMSSPLGAFARAKLGDQSSNPTIEQRDGSTFSVIARAERSHERREVSVSGKDPYGVTAELLAWGATELARHGADSAGVLAPAEAFDADRGLHELAELMSLTVVQG